jgi:CIC family chloride channel protein
LALVPGGTVRAGVDYARIVGRLGYFRRWLIVGVLTGLVAGIGALGLRFGLSFVTWAILESLGGYHPARTAGDGGFVPASGSSRPWLIPVFVAAGLLVSTAIVRRLAPEAAGHGTDAAIRAANHDPTGIRARVPVVKLVASVVTLGVGGSGGTEGPAAQISAGFGSAAARVFGLSRDDARVAVAAGLAGGIGAIFHAPLGATVLGAELLVLWGLALAALLPALISAATAYLVFGLVGGHWEPLLGDQAGIRIGSAREIGPLLIVGLVAGAAGRAFSALFYAGERLIPALPGGWAARALIGGAAVGAAGIAVPGVLGTGYGSIEELMQSGHLAEKSVWIIVAMPVAKMVFTTVTIGSGGSAGVFGPAMVIGAGCGAAVWRVAEVLGSVPSSASPVAFVVVGIAAGLGPITHAPIAVTIMTLEVTRAWALLPAIVPAVALAMVVVGSRTIYRAQSRQDAGDAGRHGGLDVVDQPGEVGAVHRRVVEPAPGGVSVGVQPAAADSPQPAGPASPAQIGQPSLLGQDGGMRGGRVQPMFGHRQPGPRRSSEG